MSDKTLSGINRNIEYIIGILVFMAGFMLASIWNTAESNKKWEYAQMTIYLQSDVKIYSWDSPSEEILSVSYDDFIKQMGIKYDNSAITVENIDILNHVGKKGWKLVQNKNFENDVGQDWIFMRPEKKEKWSKKVGNLFKKLAKGLGF